MLYGPTKFSVYISYFYPNSLSIRDKNFLLGLTSHRKPDYSYPLDSPALVLEWTDKSHFALEEIGNFSLFNYILSKRTIGCCAFGWNPWIAGLKRMNRPLRFPGAPKDEALKRSYTCLNDRPDALLSRRVEESFPEYLNTILTLPSMTPEEAKILCQYLPDKKFELVCTTNKKPRFPEPEDVHIVLDYFKTQGWISSDQLLPSGGYRAFPKQRKFTKTP